MKGERRNEREKEGLRGRVKERTVVWGRGGEGRKKKRKEKGREMNKESGSL